MVDQNTELGDHSDISRKLVLDVEAFMDEVGNRRCSSHFESVTVNGKFLKGKQLGQKPERFVEDNLIEPVLETLGHSVLARPVQYAPRWSHGRGIPDFSLTTIPTATTKEHDVRLFVEAKPANKLHYARDDIKEYLKKDLDLHALAVITDGIEWELWIRPRNEPLGDEPEPHADASLRDVIGEVKSRNIENESYHAHAARNLIDAEDFGDFTASSVLDTVRTEFDIDV